MMPRTDILERKEEILKWIEECQSKAYICRQLNCKPETLNSYLIKMGISYQGNQGLKGFASNQYKTAEEYIKGNNISSHKLKEKMIKDGLKKHQCELCLLEEWQGKPIPLELHHKDGNHYNNDFSNLQILCPNCHAMQENNSGAGIKRKKRNDSNKNFCIDCHTEISPKATRCKSCAAKEKYKNNEKNLLSREQLKFLIRTKSFVQIGKEFNVSDNAIRKWCDTYNLPRTKKEINSYTDCEWINI